MLRHYLKNVPNFFHKCFAQQPNLFHSASLPNVCIQLDIMRILKNHKPVLSSQHNGKFRPYSLFFAGLVNFTVCMAYFFGL